MPISNYDRYFGGNASKAKRAMTKRYGSERGESIFYATMNKRKKKGSPHSQAIRERMKSG